MVKQVQCQMCGVLFEPRTSGGRPQTVCSAKCRARADNVKQRAKVSALVIRPMSCAECGKPVVQPTRGRPRRYCSAKCTQRVANRAQNRRRLPVVPQAERQCENDLCNLPFIPKRRDQVFCSPRCRMNGAQNRRNRGGALRQGLDFERTCVECGQVFVAKKANAKWCSSACRIRTNGRDASRRRHPGSRSELYTDREIFGRDNWTCYLCGKKVDRNADRRDPEGATIDHIIPLSMHGEDVASNVATAHWKCNRDKGVRAMNEQLRLI